MPLPLLVPIVATLAASSGSAAISTGGAVAIGAGVAAAGGGGGWYWWRYTHYTADQWFEFSQRYYEGPENKRSYKKARQYCEKGIAKDPHHIKSLFRLGTIYRCGQGVDINTGTAREYYARAADAGDYSSLTQVVALDHPACGTASQWNNAGRDYYYGQNGKLQDYKKARACNEFALGLDARHAESLYMQGQLYARGLGVEQNIARALAFFEMAVREGHREARTQFLILTHHDVTTASAWCQQGDQYFFAPANEHDLNALACYEKSRELNQHNKQANDALAMFSSQGDGLAAYNRLQLAWLQNQPGSIEDQMLVLQCLKMCTENDNAHAVKMLDVMIDRHPDCAWQLAQQYSDEKPAEAAVPKYWYYCAMAAIRNHTEAHDLLFSKAQSNDANAQYALGIHYYYKKGDVNGAIDWCMLAVQQGHHQARVWLQETRFSSAQNVYIAKKYENGDDGILRNLDNAILFYQKSDSLRDAQLAYHLGELCQMNFDIGRIDQHPDQIFEHFIRAAKLGHPDATEHLERLGHEVSPEMQINLGTMYHLAPFRDSIRAAYWYQKAAEGGSLDAQRLLERLKTGSVGINENSLFRHRNIPVSSGKPCSRRISLK